MTCDHNEWKDSSTCKVTLSMLNPSKDHPHACQLCLQDVGGTPSIGNHTEEKDARGYTGESVCVCFFLFSCAELFRSTRALMRDAFFCFYFLCRYVCLATFTFFSDRDHTHQIYFLSQIILYMRHFHLTVQL